jgi:hypothetical protein
MNRKSGTDHGFPLCEDQIIELWLHRLLHRFAWPPRLPSAVGPKPPKNRGLSPIITHQVQPENSDPHHRLGPALERRSGAAFKNQTRFGFGQRRGRH